MKNTTKQAIKDLLISEFESPSDPNAYDNVVYKIAKIIDDDLAKVLLEATNMREIFDVVGLKIVSKD